MHTQPGCWGRHTRPREIWVRLASSLSPLDPTVQVNLADVLERLEEYESAATTLHRAIGLGAAETAGAGVLETRIKALNVRHELKSLLPVQSSARHAHFLKRSCRGILNLTADSIEYVPERNQDHAFQFQLQNLQSFKAEGGTLAISGPDGKKYNFDELGDEASRVLGKFRVLLDGSS